jgi:4-amino-4-deoxy-L-arabinose transferase-like glycosyltransferase
LLALAALTKGPLALLFFVLVVGSFAAWMGRLRRLASLESLAGGALLLALVAPWPILVVRELGLAQTLDALRATELTTRTGGPLYYLRELPLRFLPWTLLLPAVGVWLVNARPERESPALRFGFCWVLGVLIPLHPSGAKHYRYLLPLFPALALLVVALWHLPAARASALRVSWQARLETFGVGALLACLVAISALLPIAVVWMKPEWRLAGGAAALALAGVGLAALRALRGLRRDRVRAFETALAAAVAAVAIYDGARALELSAKGAASEATQEALAPVAHGAPARSLGLDSGQRDALLLATMSRFEPSGDAEDVARWLRGTGRGIVVTDAPGATQLEHAGGITIERREDIALANVGLVLMELAASAPTRAPEAGARAD